MHPHSTGETIMGVLRAGELRRQREAQLYDTIFDLLSFEKILFNGGCRAAAGTGRLRARAGEGGVMGYGSGAGRPGVRCWCRVCSAASGVGATVVVVGVRRAGSMLI